MKVIIFFGTAFLLSLSGTFPVNGAHLQTTPKTQPADSAATYVPPIVETPETRAEYPFSSSKFMQFLQLQSNRPDFQKLIQKKRGLIMLEWVVDSLGKVSDVKIIKGIDKYIDSALIYVISQSPKWQPAMKEGKPISQRWRYPIKIEWPSGPPRKMTYLSDAQKQIILNRIRNQAVVYPNCDS